MSEEEFWLGSKELFYAYKKKFEYQQEIKQQQDNQQAWLNGLYFRVAYASCKTEKVTYFEKPISLFTSEKTEKEDERKTRQHRVWQYLLNK